MTPSQTRTLARIDHDRRSCAAAIRGRLMRADKRGDDLGEAASRLAFIAYLRGMKRTVLDASAVLKKDSRAAHYNLSRADDDAKEEKDRLLWLLAFLGLPWTAVELERYRAERVATVAGEEIRSVSLKRAARLAGASETEAARTSGGTRAMQQGAASRMYEPSGGVATLPRTSGGRLKSETVSDLDVFGTFGRRDVHLHAPQSAIDVWAETIAYTQYERGRWDAANGGSFPAISEALWGYEWCSILDVKTTEGCRKLNRYTGPVDDPWIVALAPPRHHHCRSTLLPIYQSSALKPPTPYRPAYLTDATLYRYLEEKERFEQSLR